MLPAGRDIAEVEKTPSSLSTYASAIQVLNRRGEVSAPLVCYPALKPYAKHLPDSIFRQGLQAVEDLAGIAVTRVNERLQAQFQKGKGERGLEVGRVDFLARLMEGKYENGEKLGREELTAEAWTQLIAGSDTISNTSCSLFYWVVCTPGVIGKLQEELDDAVSDTQIVPKFEQVKNSS